MDTEERQMVMNAINKAIETYEKEIESAGDTDEYFPIKITVREVMSGDYSIGEEIIVDRIKEKIEFADKQKLLDE